VLAGRPGAATTIAGGLPAAGPPTVAADAATGKITAVAVPTTPAAASFAPALAGTATSSLTVSAGSLCRPCAFRCCGPRRFLVADRFLLPDTLVTSL